MEFLSGETRPILRELEQKMQEAAADERFEEAARYRNRLFAVRHMVERQAADRRAVGTVDVIGIAAEGDRAAVQVFPLRDGKLIDRYSFHLENVQGQDLPALLDAFVLEYYGSSPSVPPQIVVPLGSGGHLGARGVPVGAARLARRGARRRARREAPAGRAGRAERRASRSSRTRSSPNSAGCGASRRSRSCARRSTSRACRSASSASTSPTCRAASPVGSMVVFQDALPKKSDYRKFGVRGVDGQDDFAAMAEVVTRRFARRRDATAEEYDASFAATPNLVVVDGGKGQLSAVLAAMQAFDLPRVAVISLAKREEEVFLPGDPKPVALDRHSPSLQLLQRIRDEAHRFALDFHRQRRDAAARESIFDTLKGVGPARRRALMRHFGSAERFLAASQEELEGVPELPAKTARQIYAQLHKAGRG